MRWYLVHTKPKQEKCALLNLERQGYSCYLPLLPVERLCQGGLKVAEEALFPRYLFIQLGQDDSAKSWGPIRSTKGVSRLVSFGNEPARVADGLIDALRARDEASRHAPGKLFTRGERVRLTAAPFADVEGIYQMADGERRVMVLIELLSRQVRICVSPASLRKVG